MALFYKDIRYLSIALPNVIFYLSYPEFKEPLMFFFFFFFFFFLSLLSGPLKTIIVLFIYLFLY